MALGVLGELDSSVVEFLPFVLHKMSMVAKQPKHSLKEGGRYAACKYESAEVYVHPATIVIIVNVDYRITGNLPKATIGGAQAEILYCSLAHFNDSSRNGDDRWLL